MIHTDALKDLLYRLADDSLIIGHRNSEWTGFGPILEEDIAFSSMAQDEIGYALAYYSMLETLGEKDPDALAFGRNAAQFRCCQLVEWPIEDYAFSLMRHFLYDYAQATRLRALKNSAYLPLAELANKIFREHKYHAMHAKTWTVQLGVGGEESRLRMQTALNIAFPMAFGLFEATAFSEQLAKDGVQPSEESLCDQWLAEIALVLASANLILPDGEDPTLYLGGRNGYHTEHLQPLLDEMTVVFRIDETAKW